MRTRSGFSLIEMMVVMLLTSLALSLGFQSLLQWQRAQESLASAGGAVLEVRLAESWWRAAMRGVSSRFDASLKGNAQGFEATSSSSPLNVGGIDGAQQWRIESNRDALTLVVIEEGRPSRFPLSGVTGARFTFLDKAGEWHNEWPPTLGIQQERPSAVALTLSRTSGELGVWIAALHADAQPYFPLAEPGEF